MRVGQLTTWLSTRGGGIPSVVIPFAEHLINQGIDPLIFCLSEDGAEFDVGMRLNRENVHPCRPLDRGVFGYTPNLLSNMLKEDLHLVHQHGLWQFPSVACLQWHIKTSRPYLVTVHGMLDSWALSNSQWKKRIANWLFQNRHLRDAACLHALNEAELRVIRQLGMRNPVAVVPNGIDLPRQEANTAPPMWAKDVPDGNKVLLYLGRIHEKKGLRTLINAWKQVMERGWTLVIAGWDQGGHEADLKRLVQELDISREVIFVGPQFGKEKVMSFERADAFVLPSYSEGLPMVVLEAWSFRLPVLMTAACNIPKGFEIGAALELPMNTLKIGGVLEEFFGLTDCQLMRMGNTGRLLVEDCFTWGQVAQDMASVYEWVLGGGSCPSVVSNDY